MQIDKNQIKRPSLIEPFFDKELTPDNEFVTYIDCSTNAQSVVHKKNVTPTSHNIKKPLKSKNYRRAVDNELIKECPVLPFKQSSGFVFVHDSKGAHIFIQSDVDQHINYFKEYKNFSIFDIASAVA